MTTRDAAPGREDVPAAGRGQDDVEDPGGAVHVEAAVRDAEQVDAAEAGPLQVDPPEAGLHQDDVAELLRSRDELARRVEADRVLHELAARITALRDPEELLQEIVDHAQRLTGSDGAHLTLRVDGSRDLRPCVMTGATQDEERAWLRSLRLEPGVVKHAKASHATVTLHRDGDDLCLEVADDGVGFDEASVPVGHLGVVGMRARAGLIGGRLNLETRPGEGTRIRVAVPVTFASERSGQAT